MGGSAAPAGPRSMPSPAFAVRALLSKALPVPLWTETPSPPFALMRLPRTTFPVEPLKMWTPWRALLEMRLSCAAVPPTRLLLEALIATHRAGGGVAVVATHTPVALPDAHQLPLPAEGEQEAGKGLRA